VLHFNGPDAWMDYHARFGRGSLLGAIIGDLERAGKNTALMRRLGAEPAGGVRQRGGAADRGGARPRRPGRMNKLGVRACAGPSSAS
jgi:hypothetical protein